MTPSTPVPFPYAIIGAHTELGPVITMDEWAKRARVPHRHDPDGHLDGPEITRLLGVEGKSWGPERFASLDAVAGAARTALAGSGIRSGEVDAVIVVTCTPYQILMDQDAFALMRSLGIPDHVLPLQLGAGCGGLARAAALVARLRAERALVISYNIASRIVGFDEDGALPKAYRDNSVHPYGKGVWASPALFSDAAAAVVLERDEDAAGVLLYSRDSQSFDDGPGITDPLIHILGGGNDRAVGLPGSAELACFGMNAPEITRYYSRGMTLNHRDLNEARPGYLDEVARFYTHQANPTLVDAFIEEMGLSRQTAPSNVRQLGNTVSPSTLALLHADHTAGNLAHGDRVCFSVVGAGPERGTFIAPVRIPSLTRRAEPRRQGDGG
ncbi:3-oxoacyl-[acyl-carrier-protein] synthase III C-terminal domain-containing protein [Streptomyces sp. NPDC051183]|uniref:3-oxoacyl-[acyl-carrier-protein] synthase III C-terminal domain-containing protein n=1 Tax=Streptomyces sp. NPDC051183 TaxID=3155165 RepID=UPI00342AF0B7